MGLYATLEDASVQCPRCSKERKGNWQFQFGSVEDLPNYHVGEFIRWTGGQAFGWEEMQDVSAVAYPTFEPFCQGCTDNVLAEVRIISNRIECLDAADFGAWNRALFFVGPQRTAYFLSEKQPGHVTNEVPDAL